MKVNETMMLTTTVATMTRTTEKNIEKSTHTHRALNVENEIGNSIRRYMLMTRTPLTSIFRQMAQVYTLNWGVQRAITTSDWVSSIIFSFAVFSLLLSFMPQSSSFLHTLTFYAAEGTWKLCKEQLELYIDKHWFGFFCHFFSIAGLPHYSALHIGSSFSIEYRT